jgi:tRNA threonylcarbamoyladenosine biosynthesis protein TsaE
MNQDCNHNWIFLSQSEEATYELGKRIGQLMPAGFVLGLNGTLGCGKTKLTQGIVAGLGLTDQVVVSPTFTLCIPYQGRISLWHLDAYRINDDDEVYELGLDEAVDDGCSIVIEWVDKIRELIPPLDLVVDLEHESATERQLAFSAFTPRAVQLTKALGGAG